MLHRILRTLSLTIGLGLGFSSTLAAQATEPNKVLDAAGFQSNRSYTSEQPFEHIDTLSGNLVLGD